jgi:RimJ/RimL family protein N-acetyltransferase
MSADAVPEVMTERLILRGHALEDFPAYAAMWADPDVTRFIGGTPLSEEEAWGKFLRAFGQWSVMGFGFWSVSEKSTGTRIGEVGFVEGRRNIVPSLLGVPELGWAFVPGAHGKGYATEAARAALGWGETHFGRVRMACIIAPDNAASLRVAAKLGFNEALRTTYKNEPTIMLYRDP